MNRSLYRWIRPAHFFSLVAGSGALLWGADCADCHREIFLKQSATHHAHALSRFERSKAAEVLRSVGNLEEDGYSYLYEGNTVQVSNSDSIARATLAWAFGAGVQGITPVGFLNGSYFEHRYSWYRILNQPSISPGHLPRIKSMYFALGLFESPGDATRCFGCHATGVEEDAFGNPDLSRMTPGVTCERCHGPGENHVKAVRSGRPAVEIRRVIFNSGRLPAKASIEVCGGCHRVPLPGSSNIEPEKKDRASVRFQPLGLLASKCFQVSGQLSCLWCHDPHDDVVRSARYYTAKCQECHRPPRDDDFQNAGVPSGECKRNQGQDCIPCHMRSTRLFTNLTFTDHRIRIF